MPKPTPIQASWYDYPQYYDLAFRSEKRREADFIEAACRKYGPVGARRLLEPACGTGRLVTEMAARGYDVTGIDLSGPALRYLQRRLKRRGLSATLFEADMADFRLEEKVDAAFCTLNSFRHLLSERAARSHLECVAEALRPGGIYILGLHLMPPDADDECTERWTDGHGKTRVTVTLRVVDTDHRRRLERLRVNLLVRNNGNSVRLRDEFSLRRYSAVQLRRLLAKVPSFELLDVFDFWYDIDEPQSLDDEIVDTVLVLRRT
jgi:SAM-dependent methyltransferase